MNFQTTFILRKRPLAYGVVRAVLQTTILLSFGLALFPIAIAQPSRPSSQQHEPVTLDLSHGASFKLQVAPGVPEFVFKVTPHIEPSDQYGNPQSTIEKIQVFLAGSREPLQTLDGCEWEDMEAPPRGSEWFRAGDDMNFDGYKDIYILTNWGATGNESGCVWLYNPATRRFDFSKAFSELGRFTLNPATKTIDTFSNGGMAGMVFHATRYSVANNGPVPIMEVAQDWDPARRQYHCVAKQRRGHEIELITVRDQWMEPGKDNKGPCDPASPFGGISEK